MNSRDNYLLLAVLITLLAIHAKCSTKHISSSSQPAETITFNEVWGYLMRGEEKNITGSEPFTDICYFSLNISGKGRIGSAVNRPNIQLAGGIRPRVHLVISELANTSLTHLCLDPAFPVRDLLIDDIARVSENFDGIQIDFEAVPPEDARNFADFLRLLKARLALDKMLTTAVPARTKDTADAYNYGTIAPLVDRVIIMAYDQHWSTSSAGPVASLSWCKAIVSHAVNAVPGEKIIMGLPLYGRAWQDAKLHRSLRYRDVQDILKQKWEKRAADPDKGPSFQYRERVTVTVYYEDTASIMAKLRLYKSCSIKAVSFWRIGQGPPDLWKRIYIGDDSNTGMASPAGQ